MGFFLSLLLHLFLIGGFLYLGRTLTQPPQTIEPEPMVLDMTMFAKPHPKKAASPETSTRSSIHPPITHDGAKTPAPNPPHHQSSPIANHQSLSTINHQPSTTNHPPTTINHQPTTTRHTVQKKPKTETKTKNRKKRKGKKTHKKNLPATRYSQPAQTAHAQRKYIRRNLRRIMRISQQTLQRLGIPHVRSSRRHVRATVRFRLHPNGAISGLRLVRRSGIPAIDRRTLQVIRTAHRRYPRPKVPVQIQITMRYGL